MSFDRIVKILNKGAALTARDVQDIEYEIAVMPPAEAETYGPLALEGVAMIVNDSEYRGDAKLPEPDSD